MLSMVCAWLWISLAQAAPLLPVEQVFPFKAEAVDGQNLRLTWQIADDYFLFRSKFRFFSETEGITLGNPVFPPSSLLEDEFFGPQEIYRHELSLRLPLQRGAGAPDSLELSVTVQGCLSIEECYPPHTQKISLSLPPDSATAQAAPAVGQAEEFTGDEENEFLDPEMAFGFSASQTAPDRFKLKWEIADGYYLYRDKLRFTATPEVLGAAQLPPGILKQDPLFGQVEVYEKSLEVELPFRAEGLDNLVLTVNYQGCAQAGLCYPPMEKSQTFALSPMPKKPDLSALLGQQAPVPQGGQGNNDDLLAADDAFRFDAMVSEPGIITAHWEIAKGYYLYRHKLAFRLDNGTLGEYPLPAGKQKKDPEFGQVEVYYDRLTVRLPVTQADGEHVNLHVEYQGCAEDRLCYPPMKKDLALKIGGTVPPGSLAAGEVLSEQDQIAKTLAEGDFFWIILSFFGFGLLLSLTPCVFPMIPILSGIIIGQGRHITTYRAFVMSLVYVLAMALTYTVAGVFAGMVGENLQAAFQNPWVLGSFAVVFVLLSLSMFGFYELQMPSFIQSKLSELSNRQQGGTLIGVAIMGFLSALIVGPCVAAPLAGALIYIGQTGDAVLGGVALFALSMGMGAPLLLIGTSAGKFMPRAGGWMEVVKYVFGVMLLAVAVWMLERVLPAQVSMLLWAALLILPAIYLGALDGLPANASGWRKFWKGVGLLLMLWGVLLIVGAAAGSGNVFQPLKGLALSSGAAGGAGVEKALPFQPVKGVDGLEAALAQARAQNKTVLLDFYADWCVSCKEMEMFTFSDPGVQRALQNSLLLKADVTPNDAQDKALYQRFNLIGPPAILFFGPDGEELKNRRVIGFMPADKFRAQVEQAFGIPKN
jgi:thiol:disulfide interchange protein DsbD